MAIFCIRHVGPLVDTRGPIVMSSEKTRCINSYIITIISQITIVPLMHNFYIIIYFLFCHLLHPHRH
jgi:hypothetical protein